MLTWFYSPPPFPPHIQAADQIHSSHNDQECCVGAVQPLPRQKSTTRLWKGLSRWLCLLRVVSVQRSNCSMFQCIVNVLAFPFLVPTWFGRFFPQLKQRFSTLFCPTFLVCQQLPNLHFLSTQYCQYQCCRLWFGKVGTLLCYGVVQLWWICH